MDLLVSAILFLVALYLARWAASSFVFKSAV